MQITKKSAMTLAEVLLVLVIIGTVSALTVPTLKKYSQRTENAKMALKGYNTLVGALDLAIANDEQDVDVWASGVVASAILNERLKPYLSKAQDCSGSIMTKTACFSGFRLFKETTVKRPIVRSLITPDGIAISAVSGLGIAAAPSNSFIIDINGPNEPNMEGVDVFIFLFGKYNTNCDTIDSNGQWKFCPGSDKTRQLVDDGWNIKYW